MRLRPRLSVVLMAVNFAIIALPLGSIFFFRIYENQLVQETERELIGQAAIIGAVYQSAFGASLGSVAATSSYRASAGTITHSPISPQLDLARDETLPARPDGRQPSQPSSALAVVAGRALSPILERAQLTTLAGVRVLDENGTVVGGTAEVGQSFRHVPEVAAALGGAYASVLRARQLENAPSEISSLSTLSRGTGVRVFVAYPVLGEDRVLGAIYLSRTPKSVLRHMYEERDKVLLTFVTVLGLSIGLAWLTSRTISRPIAELLRRTGGVARGETTRMLPLERPGTREMEELSEGISRMAEALVDRAAYIRTLASHVSHEFKTPLASIQGAAELLQDHHGTMTAEERQRFLENITTDGERLKALLDRLLDLARAENAVRSEEQSALRAIIERVCAEADNLASEIDVPNDLRARISEEALAIILRNLLENAVQHGARLVRISAAHEGADVALRIRDDGEGISPANRERIFEHFFTTRREEGGTGLGLGIVRALISAHGGRIELAGDEENSGAEFRLVLPG